MWLGNNLAFRKDAKYPQYLKSVLYICEMLWLRKNNRGHQDSRGKGRLGAQLGIWLMTWPFTSLETLGNLLNASCFLSFKVRITIEPTWWHYGKHQVTIYAYIVCSTCTSLCYCCYCCWHLSAQWNTAHDSCNLLSSTLYRRSWRVTMGCTE